MTKTSIARVLTTLAALATIWSCLHVLIVSGDLSMPSVWPTLALVIAAAISLSGTVISARQPVQKIAVTLNLLLLCVNGVGLFVG
jgi:hypothetical protein